MANSTVYPYGTNGSLPSSIGLINDLKTGGADKALTAQQGVVLNEKIITGTIGVSIDSDKSGKAFSNAGAIGDKTGYGIATIPVRPGQVVKVFGGPLVTGTGYAAICFSEDGTTWTPYYYGTDDSLKYELVHIVTAGYLGICFASSQQATIQYVWDDIAVENAEKQTILAGGECLFTINGNGNMKDFAWKVSSSYKGIKIAIKKSGPLFFKLINDSYSVSRLVGLKDGRPVKTTTTSGDIATNDAILGKCAMVKAAFNDGIDTVYFTFTKKDNYTSEEYDAFGILNTYDDDTRFNNIATFGNFTYEAYLPVGTLLNYRSGKLYKVVKDKTASAYPASGGVVETNLIETGNIALSNSMAAFVSYMNELSYNIGARSSTWVNPYGGSKYAENNNLNRTTAKDMCKIMAYTYRYCKDVFSVMSTETAKVHIYGENDRDKTLKNNTWDKLAEAYTSLHGSGTMPYSIIANKPGATVNTATAGDGVGNTGFSIVLLAKVGDKLVVADAANVTKTNYTDGRTARAKAMIELLDICKAIIDGGTATGMSTTNLDRGAAYIVNPDGLELLYEKNGDTLFQPASTSKVMGAIAMIKTLHGMNGYHSIWSVSDELVNDSGSDASSPETHIAQAGDVESVSTSLFITLLVSNGANCLSLARMAGETIIKNRSPFLP